MILDIPIVCNGLLRKYVVSIGLTSEMFSNHVQPSATLIIRSCDEFLESCNYVRALNVVGKVLPSVNTPEVYRACRRGLNITPGLITTEPGLNNQKRAGLGNMSDLVGVLQLLPRRFRGSVVIAMA